MPWQRYALEQSYATTGLDLALSWSGLLYHDKGML
jgi:hypothetical protein